MNIKVDTTSIVLSADSVALKTEAFLTETARFMDVDIFLQKIHEGILSSLNTIFNKNVGEFDCHMAEVSGFKIYFKFGKETLLENVSEKDVIFFSFVDPDDKKLTNDMRLKNFLAQNVTFDVSVTSVKKLTSESDFLKLYSLSGSDRINIPLLNPEQKEIMLLGDKNVVVHGVAGSGKTNICIDKIVYSACQNYYGKVLYTTYSRGLLIDTKNKVESFIKNIKTFEEALLKKKVTFFGNKKKAVSDRLGIYIETSNDENILARCLEVRTYLENKVDYFLVEDLYAKYFPKKDIADEKFFTTRYVKELSDKQLAGKLSKVTELSDELIYKEIFGLIFGKYVEGRDMLALNEYVSLRKESLSERECEIVYSLALDYKKYLDKHSLTDNNLMSRKLLENAGRLEEYSLIICDETQDFTEVTLRLFKNISLKMFCAGDALQMINPSYFSFAGLKRILFEKDVVKVKELESNYRNKRKIADILDALGELNTERFGTHSFVVKGKSVDISAPSSCVFVNEGDILKKISDKKLDAFTVVVSSVKKKNELRKVLKNQEILTVSEIKGLERDTVLLYDVLSDNFDKWERLSKKTVNRKTADENSVYRYYFNLFYVGVSRAKTNLYVFESKDIPLFNPVFKKYFSTKNDQDAINALSDLVSTVEITNDEIVLRIAEFIKNGQYDNAEFIALKLTDDVLARRQKTVIEVNKKYVSKGLYREGGVAFWEMGETDEAKKMFVMSGDKSLIDLMDACVGKGEGNLSPDIVSFYPDVMNNVAAKKLIEETLQKDIKQLKENCNKISSELKRKK